MEKLFERLACTSEPTALPPVRGGVYPPKVSSAHQIQQPSDVERLLFHEDVQDQQKFSTAKVKFEKPSNEGLVVNRPSRHDDIVTRFLPQKPAAPPTSLPPSSVSTLRTPAPITASKTIALGPAPPIPPRATTTADVTDAQAKRAQQVRRAPVDISQHRPALYQIIFAFIVQIIRAIFGGTTAQTIPTTTTTTRVVSAPPVAAPTSPQQQQQQQILVSSQQQQQQPVSTTSLYPTLGGGVSSGGTYSPSPSYSSAAAAAETAYINDLIMDLQAELNRAIEFGDEIAAANLAKEIARKKAELKHSSSSSPHQYHHY